MTGPIYDAVMRQTGRRLLKNFRPTDTLARLTHKKFVSLYEDLKQPGDVRIITSRLTSKLLRPYAIDNEIYQPTLCLGAALSTGEHKSAMDILEAAEQDLKPMQPAASLQRVTFEKQGEPAED